MCHSSIWLPSKSHESFGPGWFVRMIHTAIPDGIVAFFAAGASIPSMDLLPVLASMTNGAMLSLDESLNRVY
jgi:6-phosphogluconate dehydrogenase (decarboxylating)